MTKEELKRTRLSYSKDITEEIYDNIIKKFKELGLKEYKNQSKYSDFVSKGGIIIDRDFDYWVPSCYGSHLGLKEITVKDILGESEEWWKSLKKGDYVVSLTNFHRNLRMKNTIHIIMKDFSENKKINYNDIENPIDKSESDQFNAFRPATSEEIKLYEHAGKPVDVTTYKIPEERITMRDMLEGNIYNVWLEGEKNYFITNHKGIDDKDRIKGDYILDVLTTPSFAKNRTPYITGRKVEKATPEESKWLNVCIKADKFIPKEELDKYDDKTFELKEPVQDIPEYVECINYWSKYEGKIFNTKKDNVPEESKQLSWKKILITFSNLKLGYFKESTKEAYEAQSKKEFVLPKSYHVVVTKENQEVLSKWRFGEGTTNLLEIGQITGMYNGKSKEHNPKDSRGGFGIEITFEQFKTYVMKTEEKKNYVKVTTQEQWDFVTEKLGYKWNSNKFEGQYVLINLTYNTKTFESINPHYSFEEWLSVTGYTFPEKEEYKVGDWVLTSDNANGWGTSSWMNNKIGQITVIEQKTQYVHLLIDSKKAQTKIYEIVRKATPEEIQSVSKGTSENLVVGEWYEIKSFSDTWLMKFTKFENPSQYWGTKKVTPVDGYTRTEEGYVSGVLVGKADMEVVYKYFPEERTSDKPFEFNKWYKLPEKQTLIFVKENYKDCYGFTAQGWWMDKWNLNIADLYGFVLATKSEIEEKLLSYAKEHCSDVSIVRGISIYWANDNDPWVVSPNIYGNGMWSKIVETPSKTKEITSAYGLHIGDKLPADVMNKWHEIGDNYNHYSLTDGKWKKDKGNFHGDRAIESFKEIDGTIGFLVSGTNQVYLRAEGFKEFMESYGGTITPICPLTKGIVKEKVKLINKKEKVVFNKLKVKISNKHLKF